MILGVTGTNGSGKDTVIAFLKNQGYSVFSCSDIIREEARARGKELTRDNLIAIGNELRQQQGHGVLAEKIAEKIRQEDLQDVAVNSIRHPAEVDALRQFEEFSLIAVNSPVEVRYARIQKRQQNNEDAVSFEQFKQQEQIIGQGAQQQLGSTMASADKHIDNDGSVEELHKNVYKFIQQKKGLYQERPDWDEYFIGLTREVAKRATCDRGRSGCVIVKDKRVLCTGYVGSPIGAPHCDEAGHLYRKTFDDNGNIKYNCVRTAHSEQNAIVQAARYGISLEGATVYCKMTPCPWCAKMIVNAGIKRVVCEKRYHDTGKDILDQAGVAVKIIHDVLEDYGGQAQTRKE